MVAFICQRRGQLNFNHDDKSKYSLSRASQMIGDHLEIVRLQAAPAARALKNLWFSFENTSRIPRVKKTSGRRKRDVREELQFTASTESSVTSIIQTLSASRVGISKSFVQRILEKEFNLPEAQLSSPAAVQNQIIFATEMQSRLNRKAIDVDDVYFTDECYVGTAPSSYPQIDRMMDTGD